MEWFQGTVVCLWLAGLGALVVLTRYCWLNTAAGRETAHSRSAASGTTATERVHSRRAML